MLTLQFVTHRRRLPCGCNTVHPFWPEFGSCMVISFFQLMANHRVETICARLHFSCYTMLVWRLHEHVATLKDLFSIRVRICHALPLYNLYMRVYLYLIHIYPFPDIAPGFTCNDGNAWALLNASCLYRVRETMATQQESQTVSRLFLFRDERSSVSGPCWDTAVNYSVENTTILLWSCLEAGAVTLASK